MGPKGEDEVKAWETTFGVTCGTFASNFSHYSAKGTPPGELADFSGVHFRVLMSNISTTAKKSTKGKKKSSGQLAHVRNSTSAVVVIDPETTATPPGRRFILPGDATSQTISWINERIEVIQKKTNENPLTPCIVLAAPHHGSLPTLADNHVTPKPNKKPKLSVAKKFTNLITPVNLVASTGLHGGYHHPSKKALEILGALTGTGATDHQYIYWDPDKPGKKGALKWAQSSPTKQRIFTTLTATLNKKLKKEKKEAAMKNVAQDWVFTVTPSGKVTALVIEREPIAFRPPTRLVAVPAQLRAQPGSRQRIAAVRRDGE